MHTVCLQIPPSISELLEASGRSFRRKHFWILFPDCGAGGGGAQGENMGAVAEQLSGAGSANDAPTKTLSDVAPKRFLRFRATGAQLVGQNV